MRDLSSIVGLQVIATDEGRRVGSVSQVIVDLAAAQMVAVVLGEAPEQKAIAAADLGVIGQDALMVASASKAKPWSELKEELSGGADVLEHVPVVVTDKGTSLGHLASVQFDPATKRVTRYEVTGGVLRDVIEGVVSLPLLEGTVHGEDTIIVPHEAAQEHLAQSKGGLRGQLEKLRRVFRTQYEEASEQSEALYKEGGEKLRAGAAKAREAAGRLSREAHERLQALAEKRKDEDEAPEDD